MKCPICSWSSDDQEYPLIHETKFWRVVLAPNQSLVGRCIIHLKRHCGDIAEMRTKELLEWLSIVSTVENTLRRAFDATMFNWSCYMNIAYRENPPDPHIHWWAVPRYEHPVKIGKLLFEDALFGNPYDHATWRAISMDERRQIMERLQQAMG